MCGQHHDPAALHPGKVQYPSYSRLGEPQGRSGRHGKSRPHSDSISGAVPAESLNRLRSPDRLFRGKVIKE
jgi:hypothetical protein